MLAYEQNCTEHYQLKMEIMLLSHSSQCLRVIVSIWQTPALAGIPQDCLFDLMINITSTQSITTSNTTTVQPNATPSITISSKPYSFIAEGVG